MIKEKKEKRVTLRLSDSDYDYLSAIAYMAGNTVSGYIRMLINASVTAAKVQEKKGVFNLEDVKTIFNDKLQ
jgi:uncharacterized protein (DUF1778 family)